MEISERKLTFCFNDSCSVLKFDECAFYRKYFNPLARSKGVDFIATSPDTAALIEVKDFYGHERENRYKLITGKEGNLITEIAAKTAMTLVCLYGAFTKSQTCQTANDLMKFYSAFQSNKIPNCKEKINVVLFLEGNFESASRTKKMVMNSLKNDIQKQLKWLNCYVTVIDLDTYSAWKNQSVLTSCFRRT